MPKKKKTRKQKILADTRQKVIVEVTKVEYETQTRLDRDQQIPVQMIDASRYQYLSSDLFKTIVLTLSIIAGELILGHLFV
jgi:hypothetical protein